MAGQDMKTDYSNFPGFFLNSKKISLDDSKIRANLIVITNEMNMMNHSMLHTTDCGFAQDAGPGTGDLVVSYEYNCGFTGGSFSGYGGFGIADTLKFTQSCMLANLNKFPIYAGPVWPQAKGSTSSIKKFGNSPHKQGYGSAII
jgi:hypothetical protein